MCTVTGVVGSPPCLPLPLPLPILQGDLRHIVVLDGKRKTGMPLLLGSVAFRKHEQVVFPSQDE